MRNITIAIRTAQAVLSLLLIGTSIGSLWVARELASHIVSESPIQAVLAWLVFIMGFVLVVVEVFGYVALHEGLEDALFHSKHDKFRTRLERAIGLEDITRRSITRR